MPQQLSYDLSTPPWERIALPYGAAGIRASLSRAARDAWNTAEGEQMRREMSIAAQSIRAGYQRALQGARGQLSQVARSSGYADRLRALWSGA